MHTMRRVTPAHVSSAYASKCINMYVRRSALHRFAWQSYVGAALLLQDSLVLST
jgi:hypothetical protein